MEVDQMHSFKEPQKRKQNPVLKANFFSKWFFLWTREILKKGHKDVLQTEDLYEQLPRLESASASSALFRRWEREVKRKNPSLLRIIFAAFGWKFVPLCILYSLLEISIHACQPLFLGGLVDYFSDVGSEMPKKHAYLYAAGIVLCSLINTLCYHPFMFHLFELGTKVRLACAGLIYRKCLRAAVTADNSGISGFAIALLSTDLPQFNQTFTFFHELWKGPIECALFGYIIYRVIGWTALVGIATLIVFIPLQAWAAKATARFKSQSADYGDDRVKLMNEIITAIQVIKMYAWEKSFARIIAAIRRKEVNAIRGSMNIYAALQCTSMISKLSLFLCLLTYVYTENVVTAQKVFIVSSYYDRLNDSLLHYWPLAVNTWMETSVIAKRIVVFLMQSEDPADGGIENFGVEDKDKGNFSGRVHNPRALGKSVILHKMSASWGKADNEKHQPHIQDITFEVRERQFVGIIGNVGAGKTTLLNALLGELEITEGNIEINGVISYAPQEPWIFQTSLRDNIVFMDKFDLARYKAVISACQLEKDFQQLPYGDTTIVGERGISLSGGQKARISLARAVYRQADIYIFDDPLSAVDSHVGRRLLDNCMHEFLDDKIRILVTHRVQMLKHVDHLVLMEAGRATIQGNYDTLKNLVRFRMSLVNDIEVAKLRTLRTDSIFDKDDSLEDETKPIKLHDSGECHKEQQIRGRVKFRTYLAYFRTLRLPWVALVVIMLFFAARGCQAAMEIFISKWATWEETQPYKHESFDEYSKVRKHLLLLYSILMLSTLILYLLRSFGFFLMCLRISLRIHDRLFDGIIRAYMRFFQLATSGRVLNRFSSDIAAIDVELPEAMMDSIEFYVNAVAVLVVVALANTWLLIPAFAVIGLLYLCRSLYIGSSRSLKRMETITRSPIYSHTIQTMQGLTTIRALNAGRRLENEFHRCQNENTSALFLYASVNRAFALWTDLICVLYTFSVTFSFLFIDRNYYSGDVGLAVTQSMTLIMMCQWGMRQISETENNMTSVERILEYAQTPAEPPFETDTSVNLPKNWPSAGQIHFHELRLRYSDNTDHVLKGLDFTIKPKEKVGIVGRTGAGKSSIIQALFRLAINDGQIEIDGYDIATLGLHDLRSRISIIPQDPILFSGTLRYNLDPFEEKTDEELWQALDDVKLKSVVTRIEGGLSCHLHEGGYNFSMGQRQLVCMARAILRHNKILIMDEATANVDPETDLLIQEAIHTKFASCTVLTIAHRLHTVMDNDRVLVMDLGRVVELGHPHELLQNRRGFLYRFVEKCGVGTAKHLRYIAEQSYRKRVTSKRSRDESVNVPFMSCTL